MRILEILSSLQREHLGWSMAHAEARRIVENRNNVLRVIYVASSAFSSLATLQDFISSATLFDQSQDVIRKQQTV